MKQTVRDSWRVVGVVRPQLTKMSIASLGFKDTWGDPLEGQVWGKEFEITVLPKRLGDIGMGISMSASLASRDIEGDYRKACEVIRAGMLQHPNVVDARIEWDQYDSCSHCGSQWEVLANRGEVGDCGQQDGLSVIGEPVCCLAGINEFRAERGIALCSG